MSFEDRLRDRFRKADANLPGERLDWSATMTKARRGRMKLKVLSALAAASVLGLGAYAVANLDQDAAIGPAVPGPTGESPEPEGTASAIESPSAERTCSSAEIAAVNEETPEGLPAEVAETRQRIIELALDCRYEDLEALALEGGPFGYSFGVEKSPARFWAAREREAEEAGNEDSGYMRRLVQMLSLPHCVESQDDGTGTDTEATYYVWPRVHCAARTDADWADLEGIYRDEVLQQMRESDLYYGFRVGILENGDWVYFIAGD